MSKPTDRDIRALVGAAKALNLSTSRRMLLANLHFLFDRAVRGTSSGLPKHLKLWQP